MFKSIDWTGYVFISFFAVPFFVFNILPIFFGTYVSFNEWGIFGDPEWVGLDNYRNILTDRYAHLAFKNVLFYVLFIYIHLYLCYILILCICVFIYSFIYLFINSLLFSYSFIHLFNQSINH